MGILNVTPDSFSDGGQFAGTEHALAHARRMLNEGADIIDVGGESTRPGAEPVPAEEEMRRVLPVIERLHALCPAPISVDTCKAAVAGAAGAGRGGLINANGGRPRDREIARVAADRGATLILMHIRGTPRTMQQEIHYDDVVADIVAFLRRQVQVAVDAGVPRERLIVDPGIGFGKRVEHNLEILRRLRELTALGLPILIGTSRKRFIGEVLGGLPPEQRVEGTAATVAVSILNGASIVRVHDVLPMVRVARMTDAIRTGYGVME